MESRPTFEVNAEDSKKSKAKDRLFEDRPSLGQAQERSRPRTKDIIFVKIIVGKLSIIFKRENFEILHCVKLLMIIRKQ